MEIILTILSITSWVSCVVASPRLLLGSYSFIIYANWRIYIQSLTRTLHDNLSQYIFFLLLTFNQQSLSVSLTVQHSLRSENLLVKSRAQAYAHATYQANPPPPPPPLPLLLQFTLRVFHVMFDLRLIYALFKWQRLDICLAINFRWHFAPSSINKIPKKKKKKQKEEKQKMCGKKN